MKRKRLTHEERRLQTRERLLEAALALFLERGFFSTSLEDITNAAGYTRGAFYSNFCDKSDLLIESLRRQQGNLTHRLRRTISELNEYLRSNDCFLLWMEATLLARRNPAFGDRLDPILNDEESASPRGIAQKEL
ncbi:TetR family transcriptional regulator [Pandoraea eparura]|uniref:TetR family transcriptional regulator n=1 Tax=Pandoraea eparura TaxID=2508291 RepID=A0A5E4SIC3_9BURK|nr:TetR family transcriptional regulator [Pandoraea eparura]VVD75686.1 TetR family transcriptional regulator [Pandoraea eparura]